MEYHTIKPFYKKDSQVLILGSFPSRKSREEGFYYAHPMNRFWKILSILYQEEIKDKKTFLTKHKIALYDVCASCVIRGSKDASIKEVIPNDLTDILNNRSIKTIILNGKTAYRLYQKYMKDIKLPCISLSSTSPANASFSLEKLVDEYKIILNFTK